MTSVVNKGLAQQVFTTKKACYEFLVVEMEYFLPPCTHVSMDFLKDICTGKKKVSISVTFVNLQSYRSSRRRT
jgi:hypothetical protein